MYFVTVSGNIGVGKSTLTTLLAGKLAWTPVFEAFAENPYLADFYQDMPRWSFHSQMFFLSRRLQQHYQLLQRSEPVLQDRSIYEDAEIFARNLYRQGHMTERDWHTYADFYRILIQVLKPPNLVIYLKASVPTLLRRIGQRGRGYEQSISGAYLESLNLLYEEWISAFTLCPVLTVDSDNLDYVHHDDHLDIVVQRIKEKIFGKEVISF